MTPFVQPQYFDNDGAPLNGGLIYTYASGTSTPQSTYQNAALTVANSNPIVLNSAGRPPVAIFWSATSYKVVCTKSDGTQLWSVDGVPSTGLSQSIVGIGGIVQNFGGSEYTPITATSYPSGTAFTACHADTGFLSINSALLVGDFALSGMIYSEAAITTTIALVNLSDGSPDTPIATIASASTTGALVTSSAISFAAAGTAKTYAVKAKVSAGRGFAWALQLVRIA
jgi:hypothetical protein